MNKAIWVVIIIILIGFGVWYFTSTGSKNTNANANTNSYTINTNRNANANTNSNVNAANSNANTNANTNSSSRLITNGNANAQSTSDPDYAVSMDEYSFSPATLNVDLGSSVSIKVTNAGATSHDFVISSLGVNSGLISPGSSKTVTFTAPSTAGTYEFDCSVTGHKDLGMTGSLKVVQL